MTWSTTVVDSPVGQLWLRSDGQVLTRLAFADPTMTDVEAAEPAHLPLLDEARRQLDAYFDRRLTTFDLPLGPVGTDFQRHVWEELRRIPFGTTTSYGAIAARLDMPMGASRAVGLANGANPIAIIVPCHRVIGANGSLVGYGGGLQRKSYLLSLESPVVQEGLFSG